MTKTPRRQKSICSYIWGREVRNMFGVEGMKRNIKFKNIQVEDNGENFFGFSHILHAQIQILGRNLGNITSTASVG